MVIVTVSYRELAIFIQKQNQQGITPRKTSAWPTPPYLNRLRSILKQVATELVFATPWHPIGGRRDWQRTPAGGTGLPRTSPKNAWEPRGRGGGGGERWRRHRRIHARDLSSRLSCAPSVGYRQRGEEANNWYDALRCKCPQFKCQKSPYFSNLNSFSFFKYMYICEIIRWLKIHH